MSEFEDQRPSPSRAATDPRWPSVLGSVGIVLSILMLIDQIDDIVVLTWTEEQWSRVIGPGLGATVSGALPPPAWLILSMVVGSALALLLLAGSLALRRRRRSGIRLSRLWSASAILWTVLSFAWAAWWLSDLDEKSPDLLAGWQWSTVMAMLIGLVILLAYPVFLLLWFSRPDVRSHYSQWAE
ncbi:MAG: hypothetical protein OEM62_08685 [Acidobacteriota bacterium]|nr:hypothetical protein [Acidobacteriota bacterium]